MKKLALILALTVLALSLTACAANNTPAATEVPATAVPATDAPATEAPATDAPAAQTLREVVNAAIADAAELISMPASDLTDILGIEEADYTEEVWLQSEGLDGREVLVLRAVDSAAADRIAAALDSYLGQRRRETQNYLPDVYQLLNATRVERKGNTVALVVGSEASTEAAALLAGA